MGNLEDFIEEHAGKQVMVSTISDRINGILSGSKEDNGILNSIVIKQYLHKTEIPVQEILNIRLV